MGRRPGPKLDARAEAARDRGLRARLAPRGADPAHDRPDHARAAASAAWSPRSPAGSTPSRPALDFTDVLSDAAAALYPQTLTQCLPELSAATSFGGLAPKDLFKPGTDFTAISKGLLANDPAILLFRSSPVRIEQGASDKTVIPLFTDRLVKDLTGRAKQADARNVITYKKYPGVDHAGIVNAAAADATAFIKKALAAKAR